MSGQTNGGDAAGGPKKAQTPNAKLLNDFYRTASDKDRALYDATRGSTSKRLFREQWKERLLTNVAGKQTSKQTDTKTDMSVGWYRNWPNLLKSQGGQMDMDFALRCAANVVDYYKRSSVGPVQPAGQSVGIFG